MESSNVIRLYSEIEMLSYSDRISLLNKLLSSICFNRSKKTESSSENFDKAFGLWKDSDINIENIRQKAWSRT
ncbi:hypothetical protein [uncultured Treponema sp.]|uniref:hypothetical protein n=1 Tax=uncultured Treponema sp. TaxID=162155 RepID=UPI0025E311D8|nr:hypothetical protein [uncultured Treponema sp.]